MLRVLHFSDVHLEAGLAAASPAALLNKRALGYANLLVRRRRHFAGTEERLSALERFADELAPDVALCTGDYTALGTAGEIRAARRRVDKLLSAKLGYATVPGNHDLYVDDDGTFEREFAAGLASDVDGYAWHEGGPYVRLFGHELAVVGLASARPNAVHDSSGAVPAGQLAALPGILRHESVRDRFVLVAVHYAPRLWNGRPDSALHGLTNHEALIEALTEVHFGAVVFGHVHHGYAVRVPGCSIPLVGAGSATYAGRESAVVWEITARRAEARRLRFDGEWTLDDSMAVVSR